MSDVVITGAAQGIGAALARRYARSGARVALLDRDATALEGASKALADEGASALAIVCDVTSEEGCTQAIERVTREWGGVDVLINNAGITHVGLVRETEPAVIRKLMEVNFLGAVYCTHAALPSLLERRGCVAAISSVAGFSPLATRAGYAASKHALQGYFATLRSEHPPGELGVTLVCPSFVRTGIGERALAGDGSPAAPDARSGVAHAIGPEAAAETIFSGVERRARIVWVGREARLASWLSRLSPRIFERLMLRRMLPTP